jgi:hypothetical protein
MTAQQPSQSQAAQARRAVPVRQGTFVENHSEELARGASQAYIVTGQELQKVLESPSYGLGLISAGVGTTVMVITAMSILGGVLGGLSGAPIGRDAGWQQQFGHVTGKTIGGAVGGFSNGINSVNSGGQVARQRPTSLPMTNSRFTEYQ